MAKIKVDNTEITIAPVLESDYNFKPLEFEGFKKEAGLNTFSK